MIMKLAVKLIALSTVVFAKPVRHCKCFPGDDCWPSLDDWNSFNATVGGRLVGGTPLGSVCQTGLGAYNSAACDKLRAGWTLPATHYNWPSSPMATWFSNGSCNPFTEPSALCDNRVYVQYAVKATSVDDYKKTLAFAAQRNIRLVIRNTGHDYFGKSVGAGSLAMWTHFLKDITVIDKYESKYYTGKAMKMGAGVQAFESAQVAKAAGLAVAVGDCSTVGVAGGFTQGGGIGPLTSHIGLSADQVLEWEVVTSLGFHITATPTNRHKALYWALSGGGGGAYAAVFSVTVRAYPTMTVTGATLGFSTHNTSSELFGKAVKSFMAATPGLLAAKTWLSYVLSSDGFQLAPVFGPKLTVSELQALLDPTLKTLNESGIRYDYRIKSFDTFQTAYDELVPQFNVIVSNDGGRLMPKSLFDTASGVSSLYTVFDRIVKEGGIISGVASDQGSFPRDVENAVNPAFRTSALSVVFGLPYNDTDYQANVLKQKLVTKKLMPQLKALSPRGGSYLNEGDIFEPDWKQAFYGVNYLKLGIIKQIYDPIDLFYGLTAVGSDRWEYRMNTDGRLCRR